MRLLLDTHALLWALSAPQKLPARASSLLRAPETSVFVSSASTWEIAIKASLGKLKADLDGIVEAIRDAEFAELPISFAHTLRLTELPSHHRDPFDRIIVAQAIEEGLTIVTSDEALRAYDVRVLWA
jgi:PIN domain nuclease of toxin-antitoxin system